MRFAGTVVVVVIGLTIIVPLVTKLVNVLLVPAAVGVGLYVAVRLVNAYVNRW